MAPQRPAPPVVARGRGVARARLVVAAATVALTELVAAVDPNQPGHYPRARPTPSTGIYCPGCGSLRATHDLTHGDLAGALQRNPIVPSPPAGLVALFVLWVVSRWTGDCPGPGPRPPSLLYGRRRLRAASWVRETCRAGPGFPRPEVPGPLASHPTSCPKGGPAQREGDPLPLRRAPPPPGGAAAAAPRRDRRACPTPAPRGRGLPAGDARLQTPAARAGRAARVDRPASS